jgi:hypothetical protein
MMIWLTLLPFSLWESCRWSMIPLACLIAFLLLGGCSAVQCSAVLSCCARCCMTAAARLPLHGCCCMAAAASALPRA